MVQVNVRIEPALYAALKVQAERAETTVTAQVADAIRAHVREGKK